MKGVPATAGAVLLLLLLATVLVPAAIAQSDTVTRGGTFTVTVVGLPRTAYDIWPKGTHAMTGEPGDQPPVVVAGQVDVVQDPPGGPFVIGSHPISGGGTIRGDVPPDSSTTPATSYYVQVRTDAGGRGVVLFQTSHATATEHEFHIVAQNPADLDKDVRVFLGGIPGPAGSRDRSGGEGAPLDGIPTPAPTPVMPLPLPTTMRTPLIPAPTTPVPVQETPVPPTPVSTTVPLPAPSPVETPVKTTMVQGIPLPGAIALVAAGIGLSLAGRAGRG